MITITTESNYAYATEFADIEAVELEVAGLAPHRSMQREVYGSDLDYIAALLDLPVSAVIMR